MLVPVKCNVCGDSFLLGIYTQVCSCNRLKAKLISENVASTYPTATNCDKVRVWIYDNEQLGYSLMSQILTFASNSSH